MNRLLNFFVIKRLHSLMGIGLSMFLIEHLVTNSQAALWIGHDGNGFVRAVNFLHSLPYLQAIEISMILIPFLVHIVVGIKYILSGQHNSMPSDGSKPYLNFERNKAFSLQRYTGWIILAGLVFHIVQMSILKHHRVAKLYGSYQYMVKVSFDEGLYELSKRFRAELYDKDKILQQGNVIFGDEGVQEEALGVYDKSREEQVTRAIFAKEKSLWIKEMNAIMPQDDEVVIVTNDSGSATLFAVRDTFKSMTMKLVYTVFLLASCFHAANGIWSFAFSFGIAVTERSQEIFLWISRGVMALMAFLGLMAIWC